MNKSAIKFGLVLGGIQAAIMFSFAPVILSNDSSLHSSQLVGYTSLIVSLSLIYFGIRDHKVITLGGEISFKEAIKTGASIAFISALIYTASWMLMSELYPELNDNVAELYKSTLDYKKLAPEELSKELLAIDRRMEKYQNPLVKFCFTMLEILPIGLFISLLASYILRTKKD